MTPDAVRQVIAKHTEGRQLDLLGESRVNVLELNLDLDSLHSITKSASTNTGHN